MSQNSRPPGWIETCERKPELVQVFVPFEYLTGWFFYIFNASSLVRLSIEAVAAGAIIMGVWGFFKSPKLGK